MGETIAVVVLGLIAVAVVGAIIYIVGFVFTIPVSVTYNAIKAIRLPGHGGTPALHH